MTNIAAPLTVGSTVEILPSEYAPRDEWSGCEGAVVEIDRSGDGAQALVAVKASHHEVWVSVRRLRTGRIIV